MDVIREAVELDPTSPSYLRWKIRPRHHFNSNKGWRCFNARDASQMAGSKYNACGKMYYRIGVNGSRYKVHRIVYALVHGFDPGDKHIDHVDGNGLNNNPVNIRLATQAENMRNRGSQRNNTSGKVGVTWHKRARKWAAQIRVNGQHKSLGYFTCIDEAASAYNYAARQLYGEFFHQQQTIN